MSPLVNGNGFATIGTPDLDATVDYYTEICRFVVSETREDEVFLTGNSRHHWVRLVRSDTPGVVRIGFDAVDRGSLQEVTSRLEKLGVAWTPGGNMADDRIRGGIRFRDPWGLEIEVYEEMLDLPTLAGRSDAGLADLLHSVVTVGDVGEAEEFYSDTLGLLRSDRIEDMILFMRGGDLYHHSFAVARGEPAAMLNHIAIRTNDLDTVMRLRNHAIAAGITPTLDLVRHAASGSIGVYLPEPITGVAVEFNTLHGQIEDESYRGRVMRAAPTTANIWAEGYPTRKLAPASAESGFDMP
jgi:catechol 2,3-dioxygenase-like lactoylglutathione lyase family enzyme